MKRVVALITVISFFIVISVPSFGISVINDNIIPIRTATWIGGTGSNPSLAPSAYPVNCLLSAVPYVNVRLQGSSWGYSDGHFDVEFTRPVNGTISVVLAVSVASTKALGPNGMTGDYALDKLRFDFFRSPRDGYVPYTASSVRSSNIAYSCSLQGVPNSSMYRMPVEWFVFDITFPDDFLCSGFAIYLGDKYAVSGGSYTAMYIPTFIVTQGAVGSTVADIFPYLDIISSNQREQTTILNNVLNKLTSIDNTVTDIYDLLYSALSEESAELSTSSQAAAESVQQQINSEQYWTDKNTSNYNALNLDNFSFTGSVLSGINLVGASFASIWSAIGDWSFVFLFPLILGVSLVVVGRISRSGGKGKSSIGKTDD